MKCCGWASFYNWTENAELMNRINITYPCSCKNKSKDNSSISPQTGFCEAPVGNGTQSSNNPDEWPVYKEVRDGCRVGLGSVHRGFRPSVPLARSSVYSSMSPFKEHPDPSLLALQAGGGPSWGF